MVRRFAKRVGWALLFAVVALCLTIIAAPRFLDRIYYRGPASTHFDGQRFFNPDGEDTVRSPTASGRGNFILRYLLGRDGRPAWPGRVHVTPSRPAERVAGERMVATWVGHATVLVQTQGLNILTDPIWSATSGPNGTGPRRVAEPGIRFEDLPRIDVVLVSHAHYDHLDLVTLKRLWARDRPLIVTALGNDALLRGAGIAATARDWGGTVRVHPGADIIVTRNHHWMTRTLTDRNRALWSSFVVRLPGGNLFFAGDTGMGDGEWPREAAAYGPIRLAIIPIGAFRFVPGQMFVGSHVGPVQSAEIFARLGATTAIPIHWGTFRLSFEAWDTPPRLLDAVTRCRGMAGFAPVAIGRPLEVPPYAKPASAKPLDPKCIAPALTTLK